MPSHLPYPVLSYLLIWFYESPKTVLLIFMPPTYINTFLANLVSSKTLSKSLLKFSLVYTAITILHYTNTFNSAIAELAREDFEVRKVQSTSSVHLILPPFSFIFNFAIPGKHTPSLTLSIRVVAIILRVFIRPYLLSEAMLLIKHPWADVSLSKSVGEYSILTVSHWHQKVPLIYVSKPVNELTLTMSISKVPFTIVRCSIFPSHSSFAISKASEPHSFISSFRWRVFMDTGAISCFGPCNLTKGFIYFTSLEIFSICFILISDFKKFFSIFSSLETSYEWLNSDQTLDLNAWKCKSIFIRKNLRCWTCRLSKLS